jgi:hypothetical protein
VGFRIPFRLYKIVQRDLVTTNKRNCSKPNFTRLRDKSSNIFMMYAVIHVNMYHYSLVSLSVELKPCVNEHIIYVHILSDGNSQALEEVNPVVYFPSEKKVYRERERERDLCLRLISI